MKRFFKSIIQNAVKLFISFAPQKDMTGHFYRARLFMLGQFQKLMMQRIRTEEHNGHLLSFVAPNYLSDWRAQTFSSKEPETLDWIDSMQDGGILWDVGANIGVYSLYAGKSKNAKVFSFEPSVFNLELLARNIFQNELQDYIFIVPIALSNKTAFNKMRMGITEWGGALSTFGEDFGWDGKKLDENFQYKTAGITMDDAANQLNIPFPSFIKMDVDGLEHLILEGGNEVLKNVESILIEVNDHFQEQADGVQQILTNAGLSLVDKKLSSDEFSESSDPQAEAAFNQIWKRK